MITKTTFHLQNYFTGMLIQIALYFLLLYLGAAVWVAVVLTTLVVSYASVYFFPIFITETIKEKSNE